MAGRPHGWAKHNARELDIVRGEIESRGKGLIEGRVVNPDGSIGGRRRDAAAASGANGSILSGGLAISVRWDGLATVQRKLEEASQRSPQAVAWALNRTIERARTQVTRALREQTGLKFGTIRAATSILKAGPGSLHAELRAKGGYTSLKEFGARQTKKGVSAAPWGRRQVFDGTFIVRRYGGHVYKREGARRFPIQKLYGPAIPVEMVKGQSRLAFYAEVESFLPEELGRQLGRIFGR